MSELVIPIVQVIDMILTLIEWVVILSIVMSWLVAFNVINTRNRAVYMVMDTLYRITEPVLRPIRRIMPNTGALDLSPIVLFLIIFLIRSYLPILAARIF